MAEAYAFAAATRQLTAHSAELAQLTAAVGAGDAATFSKVVNELKLQRFALQLCHWICTLRCRLFCIIVCPPIECALTGPAGCAAEQADPIAGLLFVPITGTAGGTGTYILTIQQDGDPAIPGVISLSGGGGATGTAPVINGRARPHRHELAVGQRVHDHAHGSHGRTGLAGDVHQDDHVQPAQAGRLHLERRERRGRPEPVRRDGRAALRRRGRLVRRAAEPVRLRLRLRLRDAQDLGATSCVMRASRRLAASSPSRPPTRRSPRTGPSATSCTPRSSTTRPSITRARASARRRPT